LSGKGSPDRPEIPPCLHEYGVELAERHYHYFDTHFTNDFAEGIILKIKLLIR